MVLVNHRIAQCVVLVAVLQNGAVELGALRQTDAGCKRTCYDIADDNLQRYDGNLLDDGLALGDLLDKVGRDALACQHLHQMVGNTVVDDALAYDGALLHAVECGCVVLVVNDQQLRIIGAVNLLCLAFVKLL